MGRVLCVEWALGDDEEDTSISCITTSKYHAMSFKIMIFLYVNSEIDEMSCFSHEYFYLLPAVWP